jgi:hypothetical protein
VILLWSCDAPANVLSNIGRGTRSRVIARGAGSDAGQSSRIRVVALVCSSRLRLAQCSAQQRGVWARCKGEHDHKDECLEHAAALWRFRQGIGQIAGPQDRLKQGDQPELSMARGPPVWNFAARWRKFLSGRLVTGAPGVVR